VTAAPTGQTCSIVTRGRRSGTEHVVRVWFVVIARHFYAAARAGLRSDWLQNALHAGWLEIRAGGSSRRGPASLAPADEVPAIIDAFAEKYGRYPQVIDAWRREPPVFVKVDLGARPGEPG
jgi:hypothetical protein